MQSQGECFEWVYAYTGERSGGILTYSGWKRADGDTKDPLKLNPLSDCYRHGQYLCCGNEWANEPSQ